MAVDTGVMTRVLNQVLNVLSGGAEALGTGSMGLLSVLILIEITWAGLLWALGGGDDIFKEYLRKIVHIGIFSFITLNFASLATMVMDGFIWAGIEIGQSPAATIGIMRDPSRIIDLGFSSTYTIFDSALEIGVFDSGWATSILLLFIGLVILCLYFLVALQVFMTLIEFYLICSFGVILVPWGINKHTAFIAEKYFGAIVAQGVKLMVSVALVGIAMPVMTGLSLGEDPSFKDGMSMLFGIATIAFLVWRAPSVASGLMVGAASLNAGDAIGAGGGMVAAVGSSGTAIGTTVATGGAAGPAGLGAVSSAASSLGNSSGGAAGGGAASDGAAGGGAAGDGAAGGGAAGDGAADGGAAGGGAAGDGGAGDGAAGDAATE